jgi:hypothetical protein
MDLIDQKTFHGIFVKTYLCQVISLYRSWSIHVGEKSLGKTLVKNKNEEKSCENFGQKAKKMWGQNGQFRINSSLIMNLSYHMSHLMRSRNP